jgi:hypothetical protein
MRGGGVIGNRRTALGAAGFAAGLSFAQASFSLMRADLPLRLRR